jgi:iron complex outermembrane receptor protein
MLTPGKMAGGLRHGASAMAIAVAVLAGTIAPAQTNQTTTDTSDKKTDTSGVPEIVVTAQFRQQKLQDTPLSITAVNAALLESRSQTRLVDITQQAPSVQLQPTIAGAGKGMTAFIRGLGQGDISPAVEPGVGIYVDDVYFATLTASIFDLVDLDRIEILRGPQGTLAGMNSEGGAIKIYSRKPEGHGGYIEATLGNYNRRDFKASADFTLVPDTLFGRLSGIYRSSDGYVTRYDYACTHPSDPYVVSGALKPMTSSKGCKLGTMGGQDTKALRGSLRWVPSDRLEVNVIGDYTRDDSEAQATTLLRAAANPATTLAYQGVPYDNRFVPYGVNRGDTVKNDPYITYANFYDPGVTYAPLNASGAPNPAKPNGPFQAPAIAQVRGWGVSGTIDYQFNDNLSLKSITGFRKYTSPAGDDGDGSPVAFIQESQLFRHRQVSEEARLNGTLFDGQVHVTIGGIVFHQRTEYYNKNDTPFAGFGTATMPTFAFIQDDFVTLDQQAGFGNVSWSATDRLTFEGGIRATHEHKDYVFGRYAFDGSGAPYTPLSNPANPLNGRVGTYAGTIVDYRAVASYKFTPDILGYFQFATGFKGGGIGPRPYFPEQILGFGPEKVHSFEIGEKADLFDRRVRINADVYHMDFVGYQGTPNVCVDSSGNALPGLPGTPGLCGEILNLGDATLNGVEAELTARPVTGLTLESAVSYNDFKFKNPKINTNEFKKGDTRPGIGKLKYSAAIQYEAPIGKLGTLTTRVDFVHTPGFCGSLAALCVTDPIRRVASYNLLNARITLRSLDRNWSLALAVTNLTDKLYYYNKIVTSYAAAQPGAPRQFAVTLRRDF